VRFANAEKRFGSLIALRRVSLEFAPGEFVVFVGHNGSGKTTLLRMSASLIRPSAGRVEFFGPAAANAEAAKQRVGLLAHSTLLYDELTAAENLRFFAKLYGLDHPHDRAAAALRPAGLAERANHLVRTFSRGMRQRLAVARALLNDPALLILDEPATGLDREGCAWLAEIARSTHANGCTILMTAHNQDETTELATRAIAMRAGAVVADSGPRGDARAVIDAEFTSAARRARISSAAESRIA
jgi:heme exporter protein A